MIEAEDPPDWNWSYVSYAAPSRPWKGAHQLVDRQHAVPGTTVSIDSTGGLDAVYAARTGMWVDRRDASRGWISHEQVAPDRNGSPILMETPEGETAVVAWPTDDGIAARRRTEGRWGSVIRWKARTEDWTCEADMDGAGNVTFAWFSPNYRIQVREWPRGHDLKAVRTLLGGGPDAFRDTLQLVAGPSGDVVLGFVNWRGATGSLHTMYKPRDDNWGPVKEVGRQISDPWFQLALRPSGVVDAVWEQDRPHAQGRMTIRYSTLAPR